MNTTPPKSLMRALLAGATLALGLLGLSAARADVVNVAGYVTGCNWSNECGGAHLPAGTHLNGGLINPVQLTLGPGTYTITNGTGQAGANPTFTAWNFNVGQQYSWVWAFMAIDDLTQNVIVEGCCGTQAYSTQADAANSPFAQNYSATFTLVTTTTIDFITEDYYPNDNAGGVALSINLVNDTPGSDVPEPGTPALMLAGLALAGWARRRTQRQG